MIKAHAPHPFDHDENQLLIGGIPIQRLAARIGDTPFYAYDREIINRQVAQLRSSIPAALRLHYAIKANPMPAVVQHLKGIVDGFDVASTGEMAIALDAGMPAEHISIAGPGKDLNSLRKSIAAGITINVESVNELQSIAKLSEQLGIQGRIALRVNPNFELKSAGMKMAGGAKPFGIDSEETPHILKTAEAFDLDFMGFHIFCGSQNLQHQTIIEAQRLTLDLACQLAKLTPLPIKQLNIGGGFGIPYFPGESSLQLDPIAEHLALALPQAIEQLNGAEIAMELGRYLVGESGIYVCQVIDKKISRGKTYLVTNGGLHQHLAASGNLGQVLRKNYAIAIANRMNEPTSETVNIVGPLCTPLDILGANVELPSAEAGDLIVLFQSGAYGLSASPVNFLGHPIPNEVLV